MRLMMLGASRAQLTGIEKAKALGHQVITCDYLTDAIGHCASDEQVYVSTFDAAGVLEAAKRLQIDGIMTMGTDQPVYTAAFVAEALSLPSLISIETALRVTNKAEMKKVYEENDIPCASANLYEKGVNDAVLDTLAYPVVIKPVDSQGQRGVFYLDSAADVIQHYEAVVAFSRQKKIMVEAFYPHDEITVSGWVCRGEVRILTVTDRLTFSDKRRIGICLSHEYPSKHLENHQEKIEALTRKVAKAFRIDNGPIYCQFFLGAEGLKVNEVACRIGGAFEASFIPMVTGVDICRLNIESALGLCVDGNLRLETTNTPSAPAQNFLQESDRKSRQLRHTPPAPVQALSVQLFFSEACTIAAMPDEQELLSVAGVAEVGLNRQIGDVLGNIQDATARVGYAIVIAENKAQLEERLKKFYAVMRIADETGTNHILHRQLTSSDWTI